MPVRNYQPVAGKILEDRRPQFHSGVSTKISGTLKLMCGFSRSNSYKFPVQHCLTGFYNQD
jgi:hypothetical protein